MESGKAGIERNIKEKMKDENLKNKKRHTASADMLALIWCDWVSGKVGGEDGHHNCPLKG